MYIHISGLGLSALYIYLTVYITICLCAIYLPLK